MKRETRNISSPLEIRKTESGEESRHIEGYALLFNTRSLDLGGFTETIAPGALEGVLERSDILALLDHNQARGVLARFRNGGGSLKLEVDDKGLRYSFEAPHTALGDEVLEGVRRGDISGSSFAFTVAEDEWGESTDGQYVRTIRRFEQLYDVSPVYNPAYDATTVEVDSRGLDALKEKRADEETKKEEPDKEKDSAEGKDPEEGEKKDPDNGEDREEKKSDEDTQEEEPKEETEPEEKNNKQENINIIHRSMKKEKFSLLKAIRAAAENKPFDDAASYVFEEGRRAADAAGVETRGTILLPFEYRKEERYEANPVGIIASQEPVPGVTGHGGEVVPTDLFEIQGPLYDAMILKQLGARMLNLQGNVEIPLYSGAEAHWESEIGDAQRTSGTFRTVKMAPKRLTAELPISKQFLIQTSPSAEALIREDLVYCISDKLQATIFGDGEGDNLTPQGLFNEVVADSAAFKYSDPIDWEEALETAKIRGEKKYVLSPKAKAIMRTTKLDAGSGLMVMQNNEVYGIPALSTGAMKAKGVILGDWRQFYLASFGAVDLTVDPYSLAHKAQIRLVVNAWFDYKAIRPEAFVKHILK